jgi:WD40 repeat protein
LRTHDSKRALAAFELSLGDWEASSDKVPMAVLAANAARVRATALVAACAKRSEDEWPVRWAAWAGQGNLQLAGHTDGVNAVAIGRAGDRDLIISGSADKSVRMWDAITGRPIGAPLDGHDGEVNAVAIGQAKDRDVIVSGSDDRTVRIWDAATGEHLRTLEAHDLPVYGIAIGHAGDRSIIVSSSNDGTAKVWDASAGRHIHTIDIHDHRVREVSIGLAGNRDLIISGLSPAFRFEGLTSIFGVSGRNGHPSSR